MNSDFVFGNEQMLVIESSPVRSLVAQPKPAIIHAGAEERERGDEGLESGGASWS